MNLQHFQQDGLELVINTETGEAFASQSAIARMVEVSKVAISKWVGVNQIPILATEIPTAGGIQGVNLLDEDAIYEAFAKYKPELLIQCAKAGIRVYLHTLAGYQVTSTAIAPAIKDEYKPSKALVAAREIEEIHRLTEYISPRLAQYLIDHCVNEVLETGNHLPLVNQTLRGVVEIAEDLGLPVNAKNRSQLGKFVRSRVGNLAQTESRLVNGTMRDVCCYPAEDEDVQKAIREFFS